MRWSSRPEAGLAASLARSHLARALVIGLPLAVAAGAQAQEGPPAPPRGWTLDVGAGLVAAPAFPGSDNTYLLAVPNLRLGYADRFFASLQDGVGYNVLDRGGWTFGPIAKLDFGRDESGNSALRVAGERTRALRGLGDIGASVELGGFATYEWRALEGHLELRQGVGGAGGLVADAALDYGLQLGGWSLSAGPRTTFADRRYSDEWFGISRSQARRTGLDRDEADGGPISAGLGSSAFKPLTEALSLVLFAEYDRLVGDAADSPLVEERGSANQLAAGLVLTYRFDFSP